MQQSMVCFCFGIHVLKQPPTRRLRLSSFSILANSITPDPKVYSSVPNNIKSRLARLSVLDRKELRNLGGVALEELVAHFGGALQTA